MKDNFGRQINYLRLSVIDYCNLRCVYCHNKTHKKLPSNSFMKYEEMLVLVKHMKERGLKNVKITGGEPLVRKNLSFLIDGLVNLGINVSLTTNGTLLADKAQELYAAGLRRINIGIDCLDQGLFQKITGCDEYYSALKGIEKAVEVGFSPIKINVVLIKGLNEDIDSWLNFAKENDVTVRFIEVMPFVNGFKPVDNAELKRLVNSRFHLTEIPIEGNGPAKHYNPDSFKGNIGFISPKSESFCDNCSRLRINARGQLRSCLFSSQTFDCLPVIRNGFSSVKLNQLIDNALVHKPEDKEGLVPVEDMCQIGG